MSGEPRRAGIEWQQPSLTERTGDLPEWMRDRSKLPRIPPPLPKDPPRVPRVPR